MVVENDRPSAGKDLPSPASTITGSAERSIEKKFLKSLHIIMVVGFLFLLTGVSFVATREWEKAIGYSWISWGVLFSGLLISLVAGYSLFGRLSHNLETIKLANELKIKNEKLNKEIITRNEMEKSLRTAEERYRTVVEHSNDGILLIQDGKIVLANSKMTEMTGMGAEYLGKSFADFVAPEYLDMVLERYKQRVSGEKIPERYEIEIFRGGKRIPVEVSASMVMHDGRPAAMAIIRDITERKKLELNLERERQELKVILDSTPTIVFYKDKEGKFIRVNRAFAEALKMSTDEFIGKTVFDIYSANPEVAQGMTDDDRVVMNSKRAKLNIIEHYESPMGQRWIRTDKIPILDKDMEITGLVGFSQDITEQKHAESALIESEEKFRILAEQSPNMIFIFQEGRAIYVNPKCVQIMGYSLEEFYFPTFDFSSIVSPEYRNLVKYNFRGLIEAHEAPPFEFSLIAKDGRKIDCIFTTKEVQYGGRPAILGTVTDITERKKMEAEIRKSEENFHRSLEESPLGIRIVDISDGEGEMVYANKAMLEIYGYESLEELNNKPSRERYTTESYAEHVMRKIRRQRGEPTPPYYEQSILRKDGDVRDLVVFRKEVLWNGKMRWQVICQDFTEQKRVEKALQQSEEKLRLMFESLVDGVVITDLSLNITEVNRAAYELYGYGKDEVIGKNALNFVTKKDLDRAKQVIEKTIAKGETNSLEISIHNKQGEEILSEVTVAIINNSAGKPGGLIAIVRDIRERVEAEQKLTQAAEDWQATFDAVPDIVTILNTKHEFIRINKAGCLALGKKPEEVVGKKCYELVHGTNAPIPQCPCIDALKTGKNKTTEISENGMDFRITAYPIFDGIDKPSAFVHIVSDITELRKAEKEKSALELKAHAASRLAAIGEMAAGIAHEINNPLTPVLGFTELLMDKELPDDVKADLKIIYNSTRRTADVTRRLLTFARQNKPLRTLCNINEIIESTLQLRNYPLTTSNIRVFTELDPEIPRTMADAGQIQQVILNLVLNAEYEMSRAHGGGDLTVKSERADNFIKISVKDNGPGISRQNMEKIFTPFFTTKRQGEGTGLGLSICHGIITEHNGQIYVESEVGKGATFTVELPIVTQEEKGPGMLNPGEPQAVEKTKSKILVVDDEPAILDVIERVLTNDGCLVTTTGTARDALKLISEERYSCILLDIKLPDMSGIDIYKYLEKTTKSFTKRIIFITGDVVGTETMEFFSRTGATYLTKPFSLEQLKEKVAKVVRG